MALLSGYVDVVVLRDIIERHAISNPLALRWMQRQLLGNPAGIRWMPPDTGNESNKRRNSSHPSQLTVSSSVLSIGLCVSLLLRASCLLALLPLEIGPPVLPYEFAADQSPTFHSQHSAAAQKRSLD